MLLRFDSIARLPNFEQRAAHLQLRPWQWDLLMAADGRKRLDELARACGIECETAIDLVHECESLGLVEIVTLSLEAYRAAAGWLENPAIVDDAAPQPAQEPIVSAPEGSKRLSVSFDSFESFDAFDLPDVVEPSPTPQAEPVGELFAVETPAAAPAAFAAPFVSASSEERASLFEPEVGVEPVTDAPPESDLELDRTPAPAKSVSFSLSATTFGTPNAYDAAERASDAPAAKTGETPDDLAGAMLRAFRLKK